jgi:hypothetical protein
MQCAWCSVLVSWRVHGMMRIHKDQLGGSCFVLRTVYCVRSVWYEISTRDGFVDVACFGGSD